MTGDLFAPATQPTGPHSARNAPETSRKAANKVRPQLPTIRAQVLAAVEQAGAEGLIDEDLAYLADDDLQFDRSVRPRRTELTDENWIIDSGRRKNNSRGNACVIWVHRKFAENPPPLVEREKKVTPPDLAQEARTMARELDQYATSLKNEGRLVFDRLHRAAEIMRQLIR